ncbi:MAG: TerB family tellurite resistance protein [Gammaproteobacteria bacterium]
MLARLRDFLDTVAGSTSTASVAANPESLVRVAVAALLVEIARADFDEQATEDVAITSLLARYFGLEVEAAEALLSDARTAVDDAVSLRQFTAPLHTNLSYADKLKIVGMLWDVALEDRRLDKYEDYMIGKIADLLYVSRGDVIRLRHDASLRKNPAET